MEIIGSVRQDEIPRDAVPNHRAGVWAPLVERMLREHPDNVIVVKLADRKELAQLRNGMADRLRKAGFLLHPAVVEEKDGLRVFLKLEPRVKADPGLSVLGPVTHTRRGRRAKAR